MLVKGAPDGQAMGWPFRGFGRKLTALQWHHTGPCLNVKMMFNNRLIFIMGIPIPGMMIFTLKQDPAVILFFYFLSAPTGVDYELVIVTRMNENGMPYTSMDVHHEPRVNQDPSAELTYTYHFNATKHGAQDTSKRHYHLHAFGKHITLELIPDVSFIGPNFHVQHRDVGDTWLSPQEDIGHHCFHRGAVRGDPESTATLSICNHLVSDTLNVTHWGRGKINAVMHFPEWPG